METKLRHGHQIDLRQTERYAKVSVEEAQHSLRALVDELRLLVVVRSRPHANGGQIGSVERLID